MFICICQSWSYSNGSLRVREKRRDQRPGKKGFRPIIGGLLMDKVNSGRVSDTHLRSVMKGSLWRILASLTTILLVYIFTKEIKIAVEVGAVEVVAKIALYYGHERLWNNIGWGRVAINNEGAATE